MASPRTRPLRAAALAVLLLTGLAAPCPAAAQEVEAAEGKVEAELDAADDRRIAERLRATFKSIESLAGVRVEVEAGVVQLGGEVVSSEASRLASALARQVEGVTAVENEIEESRSLRRRIGAVTDELAERGWDAIRFVPLTLVSLLVFVLFWALARLLGRLEAPYRWASRNEFLQDFVRQATQAATLLAGALLALEIVDATALVGAVLGAAGLAGLAIGFAFRDLVENYIASLLLGIRQPFAPNDHVLIDGREGKVLRLTSRATILLSLDGNHVRIPNATVFKAVIENLSRRPQRRFDFTVGVGSDVELARAQDVAVETLRGIEQVLNDPEPVVLVEELGDSAVVLRVLAWMDQEHADFGRVRSEAIRLVRAAFHREGLDMPEPGVRVRLERDEPAPEPRAEPAATEVEARDTAPDRHLEEAIEAERAAEEPDLLEQEAPAE